MIWLLAFSVLAAGALVAFAHVGLRAAQAAATRDCGGRLDEDCAGCGALNGQRCFVAEAEDQAPEPRKYPKFVRAPRYSSKPAELWLTDGTVLLNECDPTEPLHYCCEWFDRETGEKVGVSTIEAAAREIEARQERFRAIKRARKYGGRP